MCLCRMCERKRYGRARFKSKIGVYATLLYTRWHLDVCHVDVAVLGMLA